jgi:hypothetical protein
MSRFLFLLVVVTLLVSCSEKDDSIVDEKNDELVEEHTNTLPLDFSYKDGTKDFQEDPVKFIKSEDGYYLVSNVYSDWNKEIDYLKDFNGGCSDIYITRFDLSGNMIWKKCYGTAMVEQAVDAFVTPQDELLVCFNSYEGVWRTGFHGAKVIASTIGSFDVEFYCISKDGDVVFSSGKDSDIVNQTCFKAVLDGDEFHIIQTDRASGPSMPCLKTYNVSTGKFINSKFLNISKDKLSTIRGVSKLSDGYMIYGGNNYPMICKADLSFKLVWAKAVDSGLGGSGVDQIYDVIETNDGYLFTGVTSSGYAYINNRNYYRIVHDIKNKDDEVYLGKVDLDGNFEYKNDIDNIGWQIGIGYLESGHNDSEYFKENDNGRIIKKVSDDNYLVFCNASSHDNFDVKGKGKDGYDIVNGTMVMSINPDYKMRDCGSHNDIYIDWESDFYSKVLKSKVFLKDIESIKDVFEIENRYIIIYSKDQDICIKTFNKTDLM